MNRAALISGACLLAAFSSASQAASELPGTSYQDRDGNCISQCGVGGAVVTLGCAAITFYTFGAASGFCTAGVAVMDKCMENCPRVGTPESCNMTAPNPQSPYDAVYAQGDPGSGIGGYELQSIIDTIFPFDYDGDDKDDLFLYRPGTGAAFVLRSKGDGNFETVYAMGDPGTGIGGYDLASFVDRVIPIRFDSDNRDDLFLYRPGRGAIFVLESQGDGTFKTRYSVGDDGCNTPNGLDGYDFLSYRDIAIPSRVGSGSEYGLVIYRPGTGAIFILKRAH